MKHNWTAKERGLLKSLSKPTRIQEYLDTLDYNTDPITRSVRYVIQTKRAHCFDGALFAAAALEYHGWRPLLVDLRAKQDDDHVLAVFKQGGLWGALAKSNYVNTRFRDPVYKSIRELVMSYFHIYFNLTGKKTLYDYSVPIDFSQIGNPDWRTSEEDMDIHAERLDSARHYPVLPGGQRRYISVADDRTFQSETLGLKLEGAFKVKGSRL